MIQLILPRFFENFNFYNLLQQYIKNNSNKLKFNFNLLMTGSFPNTLWNGNINSTYEQLVLYDELTNKLNNTNIPIILDFSNSLLEEFDINDIYGNLILKNGNSGGHMVSITSPQLHTYIIETYPEYNCILSKNIFYLHNSSDINLFNSTLLSNQFKYVEIPIEYNNNEKYLMSLTSPQKTIITLLNKCNNCNNLSNCVLIENELQLKYSNKTILDKCPQQLIDYSNDNILEQLINYYNRFSIENFQLDSPPEDKIKQFNHFLVINLIKNEFVIDFYKFLYNKGYNI